MRAFITKFYRVCAHTRTNPRVLFLLYAAPPVWTSKTAGGTGKLVVPLLVYTSEPWSHSSEYSLDATDSTYRTGVSGRGWFVLAPGSD